MDVQATAKQIEAWPVADRLALIGLVWDGLDAGWQPELSDELRAELDRRLDDADANPDDVFTWEQVIEHIRSKR